MLYLTLNLNPIMRSATLVYRVFATYYRPASRNSASAISLGFERRREREREREGEGGRGRERERERERVLWHGYNIYLLPFNHLSRRILGPAAFASRPKAELVEYGQEIEERVRV